MSTTVVVGAQWGDEGKGKVVDVLTADAKVVVRFNGGANAGHTIVVGDKKYALHLLPSGIVREGVLNIVGPYVVCDPDVLTEELAIANESGAKVLLDSRAPVVLPIHKQIDKAREAASGASKIGTTGRGIGPCYEDWASRRGLTLGDFVDSERFVRALEDRGYYNEKRALTKYLGNEEPANLNDWWPTPANAIRPFVGDAVQTVHAMIDQGKDVLFEGAQGVMLDVIHGGRPYCTSSFCGAGAVSASMGVHKFDRVIGVAKAYTTRVGSGPFPTELTDATGDLLCERGHEYGTTTGRKRRCGWLDLVALKYACRVGGITELVLTKADVLSGLPQIQLCTAYEVDGQNLAIHQTLTTDVLAKAKSWYTRFDGWSETDFSTCRRMQDLPTNMLRYIGAIQHFLNIPITAVGVGPEREEIIWR